MNATKIKETEAYRGAFAAAADWCEENGIPMTPLVGRGHVRRASLRNGGALCKAAKESGAPTARICGSKTGAPRSVFAVALIEKAAEILGYESGTMIGREY